MSLRVGLVCPYSFSQPGGVQNHVAGLAGWLRREGHRPAILAPGTPPPGLLAKAGVRDEDFTSAGPGLPVAYNGSVARINFGLTPALRVRDWLARGGFDLVHLHEPMTPSVSLLTLGMTRLPVVTTFHTATPGSRSMELAYQVLPRAAERIDGAIAVSREAARVAQRYSGLRPRVLGNGISLEQHELHRCQGRWRAGERPRISFVGRYDEPRKGLDVLLAALPAVRRVHPELVVDVVGRGRRRQDLGVRYLGSLDDAGRNRVLASSDAYVAPHTGRESFGIVLLEALASGAPVVASDLPAFREVVSDEQGPIGELFDVGDPEALARALLRSLATPRDLALERGRRRAAGFDWSVLGPQLENGYRHAIQTAPARGERRPVALIA